VSSKEKKLLELLRDADIAYKERFGYDKFVTRDYFRSKFLSKTDFIEQDIIEIWGSFSNFKEQMQYKREDFNIKKNDADKPGNRKYFITSYVTGTEINQDCFKSIQTFCKKEKAELIFIVMKGTFLKSVISKENYEKYQEYFVSEYVLNENLIVKDFYLNPQQINPVLGLNRYGNKIFSIIAGSPKQFLKTIPSGKGKLPHIIYTTGTICNVDYKKSKIGIMSEQDQVLGGLIVEIKNKKIFHVRNVEFDSSNGFYDLGKYYRKNVSTKKVSGVVWGDIHLGQEDPQAVRAAIDMTKKVEAKNIVIHDLFNAMSVLRHDRKDMIRRLHREEHEKTLENELNYVGQKLEELSKIFKKSTIHIVCSNHDRFLNDYLSRREFKDDEENFVLSCELFLELYKENNPIEYYIRKHFKIDNVKFLKLDEDLIIEGFQCGRHGDQGSGGSRGSLKNLEYANPYSIHGQFHYPEIVRAIYQVGCLCKLDQTYTEGQASAWIHANTIINPNKTRQMILIIEGEYTI
jgi:hypothetical protein